MEQYNLISEKIELDSSMQMIKKIGEHGFIFPSNITREMFAYMLFHSAGTYEKICSSNSPDKLDEILSEMVDALFEANNQAYYWELKKYILEHYPQDDVFLENIRQIFDAYERELYYPCLCGLFPIIERLLSDSEDPHMKRFDRLLEKKEKSISENISDNEENRLYLQNLSGFISYVSKTSSFSDTEPEGANRHWFLHGRTNRVVKQSDCSKIFLAIQALLELLKDETNI